MSRGGILMRWEEEVPLPETGSSLVVDVALPENSEFGARAMRCKTKVVRIVGRVGRRTTLALRIVHIRFIGQRSEAKAINLMDAAPATRRVH